MNASSVRTRGGPTRKAHTSRAIPLKVFIGYGDMPAVRRATSTVGEAVRTSGRNVEVHPMLWRFEQLGSSHWRDRAIVAALEADIIVLASSASASFTPSVETWVNDFLAANRGRAATIVAISGRSDAWTISIEHPVQPSDTSATPGGGATGIPKLAA